VILLLGLMALAQSEQSSDLAERVIVRLGVSYDPVLGAGVASQVLGADAALGTRGLLMPTLNTYALARGAMDLAGTPALSLAEDPHGEHPVLPSVYQRGRTLLLHLAYAELEGFAPEGALANLHLRAGRQLHFGVAAVTFDGATLGYDSGRFSVAVRGGQRAAVFDRASTLGRAETNPGLVIGGDARYTLESVSFRAEFLHFGRTFDGNDFSADVGELAVDITPTDGLGITARASLVIPELSHLRLQTAYEIGRTVIVLDLDTKVGRDLSYDLAGGSGTAIGGRRTTLESLRLNIPDAQPYLDARAAVMFDATDWLELEPMFGARKVLGDDADRSPYDADRLVWGLMAGAHFPVASQSALEVFGDYAGFLYFRPDTGTFTDASVGGESVVHDVTTGVRYVRRGAFAMPAIDGRLLSRRSLSVGLFGFASTARWASRYLVSTLDELTMGAGIDGRLDLADVLDLRVSYEVARGSSTFTGDGGLLHGLRVGVQGRF